MARHKKGMRVHKETPEITVSKTLRRKLCR